jgi:hypothetical protein
VASINALVGVQDLFDREREVIGVHDKPWPCHGGIGAGKNSAEVMHPTEGVVLL